MSFQVGVDIQGVEEVLAAFRELSIGLQKKYLGAAVKDAANSQLASLKAATPRNRGGLRRSVGVVVSKTIVKPWDLTSKGGGKAVARIGYRRGKTQKGRQFGGNHAWWIEEGVKAREPKDGRTAFKIDGRNARKYAYLKPFATNTTDYEKLVNNSERKRSTAVFLRRIRAAKGQGMFAKWAATALPAIERRLKDSLLGYFIKARDEAARRAARAAERRVARRAAR